MEMRADGKVSTNVFVARGGQVAGKALTPATEVEFESSLRASAPFIEVRDDGLFALPVAAELRARSTAVSHELTHALARTRGTHRARTTRPVLSLSTW